MLGAIVGNIVGSGQFFEERKTTDFPLLNEYSRFTDDTVMTLAIAEAVMEVFPERGKPWGDKCSAKLEEAAVRWMQEYGKRYKFIFSDRFYEWIHSKDPKPYRSFGNGAATRVSPVAWAFDTLPDVKLCALAVTRVTHNHREALKGALATATTIFKARQGEPREAIKKFIGKYHGYDLSQRIDEIRPGYRFDGSCQGTVPEQHFWKQRALRTQFAGQSPLVGTATLWGRLQVPSRRGPGVFQKKSKNRFLRNLTRSYRTH